MASSQFHFSFIRLFHFSQFHISFTQIKRINVQSLKRCVKSSQISEAIKLSDFTDQFHDVVYSEQMAVGITAAKLDETVIVLDASGFRVKGDLEPLNWAALNFDGSVVYSIEINGDNGIKIPEAFIDDFGHLLEHFPVLRINGMSAGGLVDFYIRMRPYV